MLSAVIGRGSFAAEWIFGETPDTAAKDTEIRRIFSEPDQLDGGGWMFMEEIDGQIQPMMWIPETTSERAKAERFAQAIAAIDWSDMEVHEVRY